MSTPSDLIANQTKNCSFSLHSIQKFLALMSTQQPEYSDISYKANGYFALVLRARKNGNTEVALKVLECTDHTDCQIQAMEREYAILKQLPSSNYLMTIQNQFFLKDIDVRAEQNQSQNSNTPKKQYFVQQMEMCQGSLQEAFLYYSKNNKDLPTEDVKELLAIQMFDALNLLHQRHLAHRNITTQHWLVSSSQGNQVLLKLCDHRFTSPLDLRNQVNSVSGIKSLSYFPLLAEIQRDSLQQDLVSMAKVLLQLDNIGTNFDSQAISFSSLSLLETVAMLKAHQLNQNTQLFEIASILLSNSNENSQSARSMLLLLLQKRTKALKIPIFSIVLYSHIDSLSLPIPSRRIMLDYLVWQASRQFQLNNLASWFDDRGQRKTELTEDLLKSALKIMLQWKEYSEVFDVLGVGVSGVVFGVENLKEKRKSALKLSLCTNKQEIKRETDNMRIYQTPQIVTLYRYKFFKDSNGNEFVVYELERCKYSLGHHLEIQRMHGEYSDEQKNHMALQIIASVRFLHKKRIFPRNIKLDSFLVTENEKGQPVVKLAYFSHAAYQKNQFGEESVQETQSPSQSPRFCNFERHNRESPQYFSPKLMEKFDTYLSDSFSAGLCQIFVENSLVCSEKQLAKKLMSASLGFTEIFMDMNPLMNSKQGFTQITQHLLVFQPQKRSSLRNLRQELSSSQKEKNEYFKDQNEIIIQQQKKLTIKDQEGFDDFKQSSIVSASPYSISLNFNTIWIQDIETISLMNVICNIPHLSRISLAFKKKLLFFFKDQTSLLSPIARLVNLLSVSLTISNNSINEKGSQSLLSPLAYLLNLQNLSLDLSSNSIENIGVQSLFSPLTNLFNLSSLTLDLKFNQIGNIGAKTLLLPLGNLLHLSSITLDLNFNQIENIGAQSLLSPLENLLNLSNLTLGLRENQIGDEGVQSLLSSLENLFNLSNLTLNLSNNQIENIGAQSLLSPLANLLNISILTLHLDENRIEGLGAQSLLSPLANLLNISSLTLYLDENRIEGIGAQALLSPLANLLNISSLTLHLDENRIEGIGAQSLLSPLANLLNLSSLTLKLSCGLFENIRDLSLLLQPFENLHNLSCLSLELLNTQIGDIGAQSLLSPLKNSFNLSRIALDLSYNGIGNIGAQSLLLPLVNLQNLSRLFLDLSFNQIGDIGAQSLLFPLTNFINISEISLDFSMNQKFKQMEHLYQYYFEAIYYQENKYYEEYEPDEEI